MRVSMYNLQLRTVEIDSKNAEGAILTYECTVDASQATEEKLKAYKAANPGILKIACSSLRNGKRELIVTRRVRQYRTNGMNMGRMNRMIG